MVPMNWESTMGDSGEAAHGPQLQSPPVILPKHLAVFWRNPDTKAAPLINRHKAPLATARS